MILVDTSVWVRSTRGGLQEQTELDSLLDGDQVATTEVIVAEVLQGARSEADYTSWRHALGGLHYFAATRETWEKAARLAFDLRRAGLETALSDLVIATVALENNLAVYTIDTDFQRVPGLELHVV